MGRVKKDSKKVCASVKKPKQKYITEYFPLKEKQGDHAQRKRMLKKENFKRHKNIKDKRRLKKQNLTGITYAVYSPSQPLLVKMGTHHATDDLHNRLKSLNTSVAVDFIPICQIKSNHCYEIEKKLHRKFSSYRIKKRGELFGFLLDESTDFEQIKKKYDKLVTRIVKKMCEYAVQYDGDIL